MLSPAVLRAMARFYTRLAEVREAQPPREACPMTSDLFIARGWNFDGNAMCGDGPWLPRLEPGTLAHQPVVLPLAECGEVTEHCGCCSTGWAIDAAGECWVSIGSGSTMYRVTRERMESSKKIAGDW